MEKSILMAVASSIRRKEGERPYNGSGDNGVMM